MGSLGSGGFLSGLASKLQTPTSTMSWTQLAAVVVFVLVVLFAWRQITHFMGQEFK
jgi:hypothetical protein